MKCLGWFKRLKHRQRSLDSYALKRSGWREGIVRSLRLRGEDERILLVTHFAETFREISELLDQNSIAFRVGDRPIWANAIESAFAAEPVVVTMAPMLHSTESLANHAREAAFHLSLIAVERHPLHRYDAALSQFVRTARTPTRLAYFMSFDDPLIRTWIPPAAIEILRQFGLNENELISSLMISRILARRQKKLANRIQKEIPADSLEEWLQKNQVKQS